MEADNEVSPISLTRALDRYIDKWMVYEQKINYQRSIRKKKFNLFKINNIQRLPLRLGITMILFKYINPKLCVVLFSVICSFISTR